jgi:hypothetical protein
LTARQSSARSRQSIAHLAARSATSPSCVRAWPDGCGWSFPICSRTGSNDVTPRPTVGRAASTPPRLWRPVQLRLESEERQRDGRAATLQVGVERRRGPVAGTRNVERTAVPLSMLAQSAHQRFHPAGGKTLAEARVSPLRARSPALAWWAGSAARPGPPSRPLLPGLSQELLGHQLLVKSLHPPRRSGCQSRSVSSRIGPGRSTVFLTVPAGVPLWLSSGRSAASPMIGGGSG